MTTNFYLDSFLPEFESVWKNTKFRNELAHLCYLRSVTSFVGKSIDDIDARRVLLYNYSSEYTKTSKEDVINKFYNQLPTYSLFEKWLQETTRTYNRIVRSFGNEQDSTQYNSIFSSFYNKIFERFVDIHRISKSSGVVLVRPVVLGGVVSENQTPEMTLQILWPDEFRVKVDPFNPLKMSELWYPEVNEVIKRSSILSSGPSVERVITFTKWTNEEVSTFDSKGNLLDTVENTYGMIPFVALRNSSDDFYGNPQFDLVEQSLNQNKLKFSTDVSVAFNANPIWVAMNMPLKENITFSPDRIISVTDVDREMLEPNLSAIRPDSSFSEMEELHKIRSERALIDKGLPSSMFTGQIMSGVSRKIERLPLLQEELVDQSRIHSFEEELFSLLLTILSIDAPFLLTGLQNPKIFIQFEEEEHFYDVKDSYDIDKKLMMDGIMSPLDFYNKYSQMDAKDSDEAIQKIQENLSLVQTLYNNTINSL